MPTPAPDRGYIHNTRLAAAGQPHFPALPPFPDAPRIVLKQHWHRKAHHDPRNRWLRRLVSELFNQESDEWKSPA